MKTFLELTIAFAALDPNWKVAYAEGRWAPEFFQDGMAQLERVVR